MLLDPQKLDPLLVARRPVNPGPFQGGESVMRHRLGRRLVNLLPLAQRTKTFTQYVYTNTEYTIAFLSFGIAWMLLCFGTPFFVCLVRSWDLVDTIVVVVVVVAVVVVVVVVVDIIVVVVVQGTVVPNPKASGSLYNQ